MGGLATLSGWLGPHMAQEDRVKWWRGHPTDWYISVRRAKDLIVKEFPWHGAPAPKIVGCLRRSSPATKA